jgi:hypothetical protein
MYTDEIRDLECKVANHHINEETKILHEFSLTHGIVLAKNTSPNVQSITIIFFFFERNHYYIDPAATIPKNHNSECHKHHVLKTDTSGLNSYSLSLQLSLLFLFVRT